MRIFNKLKKDKNNNSIMVKRLFKNIIFVMVAASLMSAITSFTDGICTSRFIGDLASASLAITDPVFTFIIIFTTISEIGTEIACSRYLAKGETDKARSIYTISTLAGFIFGTILLVIVWFTAEQLAVAFGADPNNQELIRMSADYLKSYFIGMPVILGSASFLPLANLDGSKKLSYLAVIVLLVINVSLDVVAGMVYHSVFFMGLATAIADIVGSFVLFITFFRKGSAFKFIKPTKFFHWLKEIFAIGAPGGAKICFIFARSYIVNFIISSFIDSSNVFTAISVETHITPFIDALCSGIIAACITLSSIYYSEEDRDSLNELLKLIYKLTFTVVLAISLIGFFLAEPITQLYGAGADDIVVYQMSIEALRWTIIVTPIITLNASLLAVFQGTKRNAYAYIITFLQNFIAPIIGIVVFVYAFGNGTSKYIWPALNTGFLLYTVFHFAFVWIKRKKISFNADVVYLLPKKFGYSKEQYLPINVLNISDAMAVTDKILNFCKKNNIERKKAYHLAGCATEYAMMTVMSGFTRDKKRHACKIRVFYKNNELKLRIRDDCMAFNIKEKAKKLTKADPYDVSNYSIRIIMGLAKKVDYVNLLRTNNLIITL